MLAFLSWTPSKTFSEEHLKHPSLTCFLFEAVSRAVFYRFLIICRLRPSRRPLFFGFLFCGCSLVSGCSFDVTWFQIHSDLGCGCCQFWCQKRTIRHACCVLFGTLGDHRKIQEHLGAQERRPWCPGLGLCRFLVEFQTAC